LVCGTAEGIEVTGILPSDIQTAARVPDRLMKDLRPGRSVVRLIVMFFGLNRRVDWLIEANVSEKRSVSIFRTEV
jgi:hypothetical protein